MKRFYKILSLHGQLWGAAVLLTVIPLSTPAIGNPKPLGQTDPVSLYGERIVFDIFRDGKNVGTHAVEFKKISQRKYLVRAQFNLAITFLSFPVYDYLYQSAAVWEDGQLRTLQSDIDDDGKKSFVRLKTKGSKIHITSPKFSSVIDNPVFPTNHWNSGVIGSNRVLNTLSGEVGTVKIIKQAREEIQAEGGLVTADRYQYTGSVETTVWYDLRGRWVKMRFNAKDGSTIDYKCVVCGLGAEPNLNGVSK
ncbi:MAG: hypothetical protein CMM52_00600 [Rhodospirillaceae bacterium]|nr:hypothetical protein [Rhodospirillaceae bacterium]|tara:strand:- start:8632 stop:9381 length:750 start_codon:yes stop_codon:yes gene_type:complete